MSQHGVTRDGQRRIAFEAILVTARSSAVAPDDCAGRGLKADYATSLRDRMLRSDTTRSSHRLRCARSAWNYTSIEIFNIRPSVERDELPAATGVAGLTRAVRPVPAGDIRLIEHLAMASLHRFSSHIS